MITDKKFAIGGKSILIEVDNKGHLVRANISRTDTAHRFSVTFEIGHLDYDVFVLIENDVFEIDSFRDVNWDVYYLVKGKYVDGYFKQYIDRYDTEMLAMEKGFELMDAERGVASV